VRCDGRFHVITRKRLFAYATLIAAVLWTVWAIDVAIAGPLDRMGKVKGTDFIQFYAIGSIVHERRWDHLYDARTEAARTQAIAPTSRETLYLPIESPQMAIAFAPLAAFSYTTALTIWLALGALLYAGACALLWRDCQALRAQRAVVVAACAAFPGFFAAVLHGQTSWVSLLCVVAALAALRRGHRLAAGVALGLLVFKPHWALAAGAVFFFAGEWRVVAGIAGAAIAQTTLAYAVVGPAVMQAYWRTLRALPAIADLLEPTPGDSLRGYFQAIVPSPAAAVALYAAASLAAMVWTARFWRSDAHPDLRLASVVIAMILVSPHVNAYDLLLLAPVFFLVANWLVAHGDAGARARAMPPLLALLFLAPMLGGLPAVIRLQCSAGAMAALLFVVGGSGSESGAVCSVCTDDGRLADRNGNPLPTAIG
jgi:glycosyl transferase family 87